MYANLPTQVFDLITHTVSLSTKDAVLLLSAENVEIVSAFAQKAEVITIYDISYRALRSLGQAFDQRHVDNVNISYEVFPQDEATFDVAIVFINKGRELIRAQLWSSLKALRPGGTLYILGQNEAGVKSAISDAAKLFGQTHTQGYKKGYRVGTAIKSEQTYSYPKEWLPISTEPQVIQFNTPTGNVSVVSQPGIFSWKALDAGTRFLFETFDINKTVESNQNILDMGCGNGIIGVVTAKHAQWVTMVDDNLLAVRCAKASAKLHQLSNVTVGPSDIYSDIRGQQFNWIVSNPPFHSGIEVDATVARNLITEAPRFLKQGGRLVIVANAFLPYKELFAKNFHKVSILGDNKRYVVICGQVL